MSVKKNNSVKYMMLFGLIGLTIASGIFLRDEVTAQLDGTYETTRGVNPRNLSELILKQSVALVVGAIDGEQADLAFEPYDYLDPGFLADRAQTDGEEEAEAAAAAVSAPEEAKDEAAAEEKQSGPFNEMKTMKTLSTLGLFIENGSDTK